MKNHLQILARKISFSCIHRYEISSWSAERNQAEFGPCFNKHGHGHNYLLEAYFAGEMDPETGMIINLIEVDKILKSAIKPIDGKYLNQTVDEFKTSIPTTENLILFLKEKIQQQLESYKNIKLHQLRLYESENLWVDWKNA